MDALTGTGSITALAGETFDAVVVGAGPAGAMAARELSRRGAGVLLVERLEMPRWKVCGSCLAASGARTLERAGLGGLLGRVGAAPVERVELCARGARATLKLRGMFCVSRAALDAALVREAADAGVRVVTSVIAGGAGDGRVGLRRAGERVEVGARAVVVAGGLGCAGAFGLGAGRVRRGSWMGLGASAAWEGGAEASRGLLMLVGRRGYLGRVRTEDGRANWAAAIDPDSVRAAGGVVEALRELCAQAGEDAGVVPTRGWRGTARLTRVGPAQRGSVYAVGDAAGYVEPITGEGISWGLATGGALGEMLGEALGRGGTVVDWAGRWRGMMRVRRARCALVAAALRRPRVVGTGVRALGAGPGIGGVVVNGLIGGRAALGAGGVA